jgi:hypothetical protein
MNDEDTTFSINLNEDYLTSTGSEYTFNMSDITIGTDNTNTITLDSSKSTYSSILNNYIDPDRVKEMCEEYPALKKAWDNFYSIYKMVDQDYKGNFESKREI